MAIADGKAVSEAMLGTLRDIVGPANLRTGETLLAVDPGWHPDNLKAGLMVSPATVEEVVAVVTFCRDRGIVIVPQGGRTGLVGGGISVPGEIVLSTARLNRIARLDPTERVAVVEAGVTLATLQGAALVHGLEPGIDLPSRGSATIGGMVSTNAGGIMAFRNGVMRHRVLGLEAVLADGTIYSDVTRVVKNSAGYDLKHLFIGAEGTLGIVTSIALKLDPVARAHATALFGLPSVAALLDTVAAALDPEAGSLCAAEALWHSFMELTSRTHGFTDALDMTHPIFLLLSLGGSEEPALHAAFEHLFQQLLSAYPGASGIVATSVRQQQELWRLREDTDAIYRDFPNAPSFDVSVPMSEIQVYVARIVSGLSGIDPGLKPFIFGHVADGNLHIVLNRRGPLPVALSIAVEALLYKGLTNNGGSISAEHGIGKTRIESLSVTAHPTKLATMLAIKSLLDPSHILNRGKVLR
jgi:FAD/FMN-containing dehydrogenase